jgi:hypothetical protein
VVKPDPGFQPLLPDKPYSTAQPTATAASTATANP